MKFGNVRKINDISQYRAPLAASGGCARDLRENYFATIINDCDQAQKVRKFYMNKAKSKFRRNLFFVNELEILKNLLIQCKFKNCLVNSFLRFVSSFMILKLVNEKLATLTITLCINIYLVI